MSLNQPRVALLTFIYPVAEPYYRETLASMMQQDYPLIDSIVVNDGLDKPDIPSSFERIDNAEQRALVPLREYIFNTLIDRGYDLVVSIDPDDTMSVNRVSAVVRAWQKNESAGFFYTPLHYLDNKERAFFKRVPSCVDDINVLLRSNFIGLSHFAFNAKRLRDMKKYFAFPASLIALDWYMVIWFLLEGFSGFRTDGEVYYRIYDDNIAGQEGQVSLQRLEQIVTVKQRHFTALLDLTLTKNQRHEIKRELLGLNAIADSLHDRETCEDILKTVNCRVAEDDSNYWWAHI